MTDELFDREAVRELVKKKEFASALLLVREAADRDATEVAATTLTLLRRLEQWDDLWDETSRMSERFSPKAWWLAARGLAAEKTCRLGEAAKAYERLIAEFPSNSAGLAGRVRLATVEKKWHAVIDGCAEGREMFPEALWWRRPLARAFEELGNAPEAIVHLQWCVEVMPDAGWPATFLIRVHASVGDWSEAFDCALAQPEALSLSGLVNVALRRGQVLPLLGFLDAHSDSIASELDVCRARRSLFAAQSKVVDALGAASDAIKCKGSTVSDEMAEAHLLRKFGKLNESEVAFDRLRREHPDQEIGCVRGLGLIAADRWQYRLAVELTREVYEADVTSLTYLSEYVRALSNAGRVEDALEILRSDSENMDIARQWQVRVLETELAANEFRFEEAGVAFRELHASAEDAVLQSRVLGDWASFALRFQDVGVIDEVLNLCRQGLVGADRWLEPQLLVMAGRRDEARLLMGALPADFEETKHALVTKSWAATEAGNHDDARQLWKRFTSSRYIPQLDADVNLVPQGRAVRLNAAEPVVITALRDEIVRLPGFLSHYREAGVSQFIVIDNDSKDGTSDYLSDQDDVFVYRTTDGYAEAGWGMRWINEVTRTVAPNQWCLFVDADELLVFAQAENRSLKDFCLALEAGGFDAAGGMMLDMHPAFLPAKPLQGETMIEHSRFFTNTHRFAEVCHSPYIDVRGGFRETYLGELHRQQTKTPLIHSGSAIDFMISSHVTSPTACATRSVVLLHFKWVSDSLERARMQAAWTPHPYYTKQVDALAASQDGSENYVLSPEAIEYRDSAQLERLGLLVDRFS